MTRAERRREAKKNAKPQVTYSLTVDQINSIKKAAADEAIETMFVLLFGIPVLVLRDWKEGNWGRKRLDRFMKRSAEAYNDFKAGRFDLLDIKNVIKEETGYDLYAEFRK